MPPASHHWSPSNLPDLTGRTAVVTGGNSGIGWHTALGLARHGAAVTLAVRTPAKGEDAAARIRDAAPGSDVRVGRLDLASLDSVREFADSWLGPLDLLVCNAGLMAPPRHQLTTDGFELQFGTNHLGHFALTGRLLPALQAAATARVVAVSSIAHHQGTANVVDGNPSDGYNPTTAYGNSKLANLLFAVELQRRASLAGSSVTATAAHPGVSATNLVTSEQGLGSIPGVAKVAPFVLRALFQSARAGADPTLFAATEAEPGSYTGPQWLRESRGRLGPATRSRLARDEALAGKLWQVGEDLTGVRYDWDVPAPR